MVASLTVLGWSPMPGKALDVPPLFCLSASHELTERMMPPLVLRLRGFAMSQPL